MYVKPTVQELRDRANEAIVRHGGNTIQDIMILFALEEIGRVITDMEFGLVDETPGTASRGKL